MSENTIPSLVSRAMSGLGTRFSRRRFVTQVPLLTAAAAACAREQEPAQTAAAADTAGQRPGRRVFNSDSRLDTAVVKGRHHPAGAAAGASADGVAFHRYDPALPALSAQRTIQVHWRAQEVPVRIAPDLAIAAWTFEGDVPGPILHVRQGDTVEFTLTNEGEVPHSMDFHAAQIDPKTAFRSVPRGESVSFTFRPRYPGAYVYHCGTAPVLMHIGAGMYGAIIVSPEEPLPPAKEFVLVQSEFYLSEGAGGLHVNDYGRMASTLPDHVVFNGRHDQYVAEPIHVRVGDRVRFYVLSAGPTHSCNFHVVGQVFDAVYPAAAMGQPLRGCQTWSVPPGGGMIFELEADIPGEFPFVNHGFGHGQKGAIGFLGVEA
jgi:nitrite reductase (NO-forming)